MPRPPAPPAPPAADRDRALERAITACLRELDPRARAVLEAATNGDPARVLADPAWCRGAVRMLDPAARAALRLLARTSGCETTHLDAMAGLLTGTTGRPSQQLVSGGLACAELLDRHRPRPREGLRVLPPVAARLAALADDPPITDRPENPADHVDALAAHEAAFQVGVTLAAVRVLRPRTARATLVHKADLRPLRTLLAAFDPDDDTLLRRLHELSRAGCLREADGRLDLDERALEAWAHPLAALFTLRAWAERHRHGLLPALALLVDTDDWVPASRLEETVALANLQGTWAVDSAAGVRATLELVLKLPGVLGADHAGTRFHRLSSPLRAALRGEQAFTDREPFVLVQPNLQIVAPLGASITTLVTLARFCRLGSVDRVAVFSLDADLARRAAVEGFDAPSILSFLERRGSHGVPANVARAVLDWARVAGRARFTTGVAIETDLTEAELRRLVGHAFDVKVLSPGVLLVPLDAADRIAKALTLAGVSVESRAIAPRAFAGSSSLPTAALLDEARAALARLAR